MNCNDFENIVDDMIYNYLIEAKKKEKALAHTKNCVRCAARLSNEEFLTTALRVITKAETAQAPAHVKANLLAAFAAKCGNTHEVNVYSRPYFVRASALCRKTFAWIFAWQWAAAAAVIVVALVSIATMRSLFTQSNSTLQETVNAYLKDIKPVKEEKEEQNRTSPQIPYKENLVKQTTTKESVVKNAVRRNNNKNVSRPKPVEKPSLIDNTNNNEVTSDFIALTYTNETHAIDSGMIVRVKVSRATLIAMGLPMNGANTDGYVKVDVVVGDDGVARAIRLVQDSSSTSETKPKSN
jgi:hypothetical protein